MFSNSLDGEWRDFLKLKFATQYSVEYLKLGIKQREFLRGRNYLFVFKLSSPILLIGIAFTITSGSASIRILVLNFLTVACSPGDRECVPGQFFLLNSCSSVDCCH